MTLSGKESKMRKSVGDRDINRRNVSKILYWSLSLSLSSSSS